MTTLLAREDYGEQLRDWARALANGNIAAVSEAIAVGAAEDVRRFLESCGGERHKLLRQELALVALGFEDFDAVIAAYLREVPPRAYDPASSDRERFLHWLRQARPLTTQQGAFLAYQQAEYAVLALARERRSEHLAFQRLRTSGIEFSAAERLHLNPIRARARLVLPGRSSDDAVFFAAGERVAVVWLEPPARQVLHRLTAGFDRTEESADALVCRDLIDKGLLACT